MAVEESISVKFKGDVGDLEKSSASAVKSLDQVSIVTEKVSQAASKMSSNAAKAGGILQGTFVEAANSVSQSVSKIADTSANAGDKIAQAFAKIANIDPSQKFAEAQTRINAFIDGLGGADQALNKTEAATQKLIPSLEELYADLKKAEQILLKANTAEAFVEASSNVAKLRKEVERVEKIADVAGNRFNRFNNGIKLLPGSLDKTSKSSNSAMLSLINLSRVAQDAPYGFIGIANNLNPLLESFQRLRAESGSNSAALKSLGASLIGGGGIGLALGVVSSLLVVFGDKLFGVGKKAEETKKPLKEVKESLEDIAAASASSSIANIEKISLALTNTSLSLGQRKLALEEYNKVAAKSNQLQESDLSNIDKINGAINRQIELLKTRALIKGAEDQLAAAFKTIFAAQFKINDALNKANPTIKDAIELYSTANKESKDFITDLTFDKQLQASKQLGFNFFKLREGAKGAAEQVAPLLKFIDSLIVKADALGGAFDSSKDGGDKKQEFNFFDKFFNFSLDSKLSEKQRRDLLDAADSFRKEFGSILEGLDFKGSTEEATLIAAKEWWANYRKGIVKLKPPKIVDDLSVQPPEIKPIEGNNIDDFIEGLKQAQAKLNPNDVGILPNDLERLRAVTIGKFQRLYGEVGLAIPKIIKDELGRPIPIDSIPTVDLDKILAENLQKLLAFRNALNNSFQSSFQGLFSGLGSNLATSIQEGLSPLDAATSSIAEFMGSLISQIGDALIQYGIVKTGLDKILKAGIAIPGGIAIALGIAAKAVGSLIKASKPKGFAEGGLVFGPTLGLVGEGRGTTRSNPEIIAPLNKLSQFLGGGGNDIGGTLRLRGNDLIYAIARNDRRQRRVR